LPDDQKELKSFALNAPVDSRKMADDHDNSVPQIHLTVLVKPAGKYPANK
jgi:hypothetical protein